MRRWDWQPWDGGKCPVDPDEWVEYRTRSGAQSYHARRAYSVEWGRGENPWQHIVAFRLSGRRIGDPWQPPQKHLEAEE